MLLRRHRRQKPQPEMPENAQLLCKDVKPDRKEERGGSKAPRELLEKKALLAEMPASEEIWRKGAAGTSSNEVVDNEVETTENDIRAFDRLANTDSTTLVSDRSENISSS